MKKIILYQHAGSLNHGCEALATTISEEISKAIPDALITLSSNVPEQDRIETVDYVIGTNGVKKWNFAYFFYQLDKRLFNIPALQDLFLFDKNCISAAKETDCCVAIGGDNYCYNKGKNFWSTDRVLKKQGSKLMLWGASIEPEDIPGELTKHLNKFDLITARDSITYEALVNNGLGDKVHLVSDSAFLLGKEELPLPKNWKEGKMIGINLSPLILTYTKNQETVINSIYKLIDYILSDTDMNIALIPHVRKQTSDDVSVLRPIFEKYCATNRIVLFDDISLTCKQLKGYISRCRFFIGARTHSIIAAYSTGVPAIALGYSVKAKGIARDLFGSEEDLVLPVQTFNDPNLAINSVKYLFDNEEKFRKVYEESLPDYIENAKKSVQLLSELINEEKI